MVPWGPLEDEEAILIVGALVSFKTVSASGVDGTICEPEFPAIFRTQLPCFSVPVVKPNSLQVVLALAKGSSSWFGGLDVLSLFSVILPCSLLHVLFSVQQLVEETCGYTHNGCGLCFGNQLRYYLS